MSSPVRVLLSYHPADAELTAAFKKQLTAALGGRVPVFWEKQTEGGDPQAADRFLEKAHLAVIVFSSDYAVSGEDLMEKERIKRWELERRPTLPVLVLYARMAEMPADLLALTVAPGPGQPVVTPGIDRDRQLHRAALMATELLATASGAQPAADYEPPLTIADVRERLSPLLRRLNLSPVFAFLKSIVYDARVKKAVFELEDAFVETYQKARLEKDFEVLQVQVGQIREDLQFQIDQLQETELAPRWRSAFYKVERDAVPQFILFNPVEDIALPETLYKKNDVEAATDALNLPQQQEFRRLLLLAQDAMAVGAYPRAHAFAEQVRSQIDPLSAQLYEMLLVSYLHQETPKRIVHDALYGNGRLLNHVVMFAGRLREFQQSGKCPSKTALYNLQAVAEELSDALFVEYDAIRQDYVLHTGKRAEETGEHRPVLEKCLHTAQTVYRAVHPYQGFLKTLVVELCGGGKCAWIERVEVPGMGPLRFASRPEFDVESTILEILQMLSDAVPNLPDAYEKLFFQLREDVYFNLLAKRNALDKQLEWEKRRLRHYSNERQAVIHYLYACLLGFRIFKDQGNDPYEQSFLRLALEYLLPQLLITAGEAPPYQYPEDLRWFELDHAGEVQNLPELKSHHFDALAVVEKIARDMGGSAAWLQVHPNVKTVIYQQYIQDTNAAYELIRRGRQHTDFRRMDDLEARRRAIDCLRRWEICYLADPPQGQAYLDLCLHELAGDSLLTWFQFNPTELITHPDSTALGYNAKAQVKKLTNLSLHTTEPEIQRQVAENLFLKEIKPAYARLKRGDESQRAQAVSLLLQALNCYREHPQQIYLELVYGELVDEHKFRWIDVDEQGAWKSWPFQSPYPFDPLLVLEELCKIRSERFKLYESRGVIAQRRFADLRDRYRTEISEVRPENGREERAVAIEIIRKLKGLYMFYPEKSFLDIPMRELSDHGYIRWNEYFLGFIPTNTNHYENTYYQFDYKVELADVKTLLREQYNWLEKVMRETGYV